MRTIGIDLALTAAHKAVVADAHGTYLTPVFTFHTTPADLEHVLARAREGDPDTPLQVVMEPTGMAWFPIAVFFTRHGIPVFLVNSQEVADLRRYYQLCRLPMLSATKSVQSFKQPALVTLRPADPSS